MPVLNKEQALKVERRRFKDLDVPELGGTLRIASVSAGCGLRLKELGPSGDQRAMSLAMFSSSIVDEQGRPLFDAEEAGRFLDSISAETLGLIVSSITDLSGVKRKGNGVNVEVHAAGNPSEAAPSESSPSA